MCARAYVCVEILKRVFFWFAGGDLAQLALEAGLQAVRGQVEILKSQLDSDCS